MRNRSTEDLIRIAGAGGGFVLDAGNRTTDDLIRIAAAAGRVPIHLRGMNHFSTDDLIKIVPQAKELSCLNNAALPDASDRRWIWTILARERAPSIYDHGYSASREDANFKIRWSTLLAEHMGG